MTAHPVPFQKGLPLSGGVGASVAARQLANVISRTVHRDSRIASVGQGEQGSWVGFMLCAVELARDLAE